MPNQNPNTANPAHLVQEKLGSHATIALKLPIKNGLGETVSELKMRRAKVGDLRAVGQMKNEMEQELALFARLTSLVPEDLDLINKSKTLFANLANSKDGQPDPNWLDKLYDAIADLAWWYGWDSQAIDELSLDDFDVWLKQLSRQLKLGYGAGYAKGGG